MKKIELHHISGASIGTNVHIECDEFINCGSFLIEDDVQIRSKKVYLGNNARIEKNTKIEALTGEMHSFSMGDESLIGANSQILLPEFNIGDYSKLFPFALASGYKPIAIGHNCWIGQSSILNSVENLSIGNNVRIGGNSQIWTHAASGELLEGCRFYSEKPVTIEDNVWLMGFGHSVYPGVVLARNTIVMSGSVISKSTKAFHTYSGIPAEDVTCKLNGWSHPQIDEKYLMLQQFIEEFTKNYPEFNKRVFCLNLINTEDNQQFKNLLQQADPLIIFLKDLKKLDEFSGTPHSLFDLSSKLYLKTRTDIEVKWMKFAIGHRARFIPLIY